MDSSDGSLNHLPRASAFVDKTEGGGSGAVLLNFEDGVKRVTKLLGNGQDGNGPVQFVLVNELVVARLAAILDAPCPNGRAVWVDEPYVDQARHEVSNLTQARPGPAFGRAWVEGTFSPGADTCREALNRSALGGLIVLYTWTWNTDFKSDHLVVRQANNGGVEVSGSTTAIASTTTGATTSGSTSRRSFPVIPSIWSSRIVTSSRTSTT
jgi:hypothetical protein